MDRAGNLGREGGVEGDFDVHRTRSLGRASRNGRIVFAAIFAVISLAILPWTVSLAWIAVVLAWEVASQAVLDGYILRLPQQKAVSAYAVSNFVGGAIFHTLALMALAKGSALGAALGVAWLSGSFTNNFVYFASRRRLLVASLAPGIAMAVAGPLLAYGVSLEALIITGFILLGLLAARRYALDHRAVLGQLADRQVALVDLERKLSLVIEAAGDGLYEVDLTTGALRGDANWLALLGYGPGELEMPIPAWRSLIHPDDVPGLEAEYATHLRGDTPHTTSEARMLRKDGSYVWVLSRSRLVDRGADGEPGRIIGTIIDISTRKALEEELEAARDLAESANRAKGLFVANMSHEIRTPLNGVVGVAGALARTKLAAAQREMVGLIQSSGQVLERLLTDILDQAKIEAGSFALESAPFDLRSEFDCAAELMRARADEKGLVFELTYAEAAAGTFEGDAVRIRQVISNLASNAIKFTDQGSVRIHVGAAEADGATSVLEITVTDTGVGIAPEAAAQLFQRFTQADSSISRRFGGTGLGLAISRSLTELMGGRIDVASQPGEGSVFTVRIPLVRVAQAPGAQVAEDLPDLLASLDGLRVLVAEDHPTNQKVLQLILEPLGVRLVIVEDGQAAVDAFQPGAFDLVLMDMQMPVMDGLAATREIRARELAAGAARTPIAMLTANALSEHRTLAAEAGADSHIAKPINPESLVAGMALALSDAGAGAAEPSLSLRAH